MIAGKPVRNCSKFSRFYVNGGGAYPISGVTLSFGIVRLDRRPWVMSGVEYIGNVIYDSSGLGPAASDGWSTWNGSSWYIKPANTTFLADMFGSNVDYGAGTTYFNPTIASNNTIANNTELSAAGKLAQPSDIDPAARYNTFTTYFTQPGLGTALASPPLMHSFAFGRSNLGTYAGPNDFANSSHVIRIPPGYDFLLCFVCPNMQASTSGINVSIELFGNMRFTLQEDV